MKISSQDLEKVSTVKSESPHTTHDPKQVTPFRGDPETAYQPEVKAYVEQQGLKIAKNLREALNLRYAGVIAVTMREADILARQKIEFKDSLLVKQLLDQSLGYVVTEGGIGEQDNAYLLREFCNRGIKWRKELMLTATPEKQKIGMDALLAAFNKLNVLGLPPWDSEQENGFPIELTKPEHMSWQQYNAARKWVTEEWPVVSNPQERK